MGGAFMTVFQFITSSPIVFILFTYIFFWVGISFLMLTSRKARDYFTTFLPQWFRGDGRPLTSRERIGAVFQGIALLLIVAMFFI